MAKITRRIKAIVKRNSPSYTCRCGRKLTPVTNPSRCPYCDTVTKLV